MEKIKALFKKYANFSNLMKVWEFGITREMISEVVEKLFAKADKDGNKSIQIKDLVLEIIEKIVKK